VHLDRSNGEYHTQGCELADTLSSMRASFTHQSKLIYLCISLYDSLGPVMQDLGICLAWST
jgi:hypothetical protein